MSNIQFEKLNTILASYNHLSLKTQNYHWNVTGINFLELHSLFESQYNQISTAIDGIAERIRAIGKIAIANTHEYSKLSIIKDGNENFTAKEMIEDLINSHDLMIKLIKETINICEDIKDKATEDMLISLLTEHEKNTWILKSLNQL